ncbi:MAG: capsule assembly Wzi family protein, partial [Ignavibacteriaceae bacterium]
SLFGYAGKNWGFALSYADNEEIGNNTDTTRSFSPKPGFNLTKSGKHSIQYDDVQGEIAYSWSTGSVSAGKYYLNWGSGNGGKLILSDKAPSFPLIQFNFSPVSWLSFTYFHGWLKSNVVDSSSIRTTLVPGRENINEVPKFIAAHMLSVYPNENISFSIGESIIYSDRFEPVYLIPVLFFRAVDHYLSSKNTHSSSGNAQMFLDASYKNFDLKTKFYGTLFVDELSLESIFKGGNLSAVGFTLGFESVDPVIKNSSFVLEYTRINPFVYMNSNNAQLYTNNSYQLGHWIGSNGYQIYSSYKQSLTRGFYFKVSGNYIVKGQKELPVQQYQTPYPPFLYGPHKGYKDVRLDVSYEILHKAFLKGYYKYTDIYDDETFRTPDYIKGQKNSFGFAVSYGL